MQTNRNFDLIVANNDENRNWGSWKQKKPHYLLIAVCGNRNSKHISLSTYVNVSQCNENMPTLIKIEVIFFFPACFIIGKQRTIKSGMKKGQNWSIIIQAIGIQVVLSINFNADLDLRKNPQ